MNPTVSLVQVFDDEGDHAGTVVYNTRRAAEKAAARLVYKHLEDFLPEDLPAPMAETQGHILEAYQQEQYTTVLDLFDAFRDQDEDCIVSFHVVVEDVGIRTEEEPASEFE